MAENENEVKSTEEKTASQVKDASKSITPPDLVQVKVYSPFKIYFDGPAKSVSAESATGPFDILPRHHNFITLLEPCELMVRVPDGADLPFPIQGGIMHVKADEIIVFLDV
ncbi:MAG: F0F1 ATP synthase subunit epsilon [Candidatus Saccharimonadales bacterium]|jgi:F0F1-type ATP synthase epsilon subunit